MDPFSFLFEFSVGLFVNKDPLDPGLLRESLGLRETDYVRLQVDAFARSFLLSSISFYKEGVCHLFKLKSRANERKKQNASKDIFAGISENSLVKACPAFKEFKLSNLHEADQRALNAAKKEFEKARSEAVRAFNNESLSVFDRIRAMVIRVASVMLENIDHPEDALSPCIFCLEELHGLKEVQENFSIEIRRGVKHLFYKEYRKQIMSSVCRINHFVRNIAVKIAMEGELLKFPLIEIEGEKVDPLNDPRVAEALRKFEMPHYAITPSALGQKGETKKPKIPQGIAVNSQEHFVVGDEWECRVNIFDFNGHFVRPILFDENKSVTSIVDVAVDSEDNVYVLLDLKEKAKTVRFKICLFDKEGNRKQEFPLREKTVGVLRMTVSNNNEIFVLTMLTDKVSTIRESAVDVYDSDGSFTGLSFGEKTLRCPQDICVTSDDRVLVLDRNDQCVLSVQMFHANGEPIDQDLLKAVKKAEKTFKKKFRSSIACHQVSNDVVIAFPSETDKHPARILRYGMSNGELLPSVDLPIRGQISTRGVAVTTQGRIAIGLLDKGGGDSKVLIL